MTTQAHRVGASDMTPEQVGMLNGRAAALQAATADLLERGYLRQTAYGRLEAWTIPPADVTPLQRAVVDAVRCRAPRLENVPAVRAALDELQRDAVRRGLLNPPRRGGKGEALKMTFMTLFGVALAIIAATGKSVGGVVVGLGFTCFGAYNLVRAVRTTRQGRRTPAGAAALEQIRLRVPSPAAGLTQPPMRGGLGYSVGLYGTRPLLIAFPATAALGWGLSDHVVDEEMQRHARASSSAEPSSTNGYTCSSGTSSSDWSCDTHSGHSGGSGGSGDAWCSGGNCCGSAGSCNSGSCGGGSSCGGSSCGSSCGGGSSCSS